MNQNALAEYYATDRKELVAFVQPHGPFETALDIGCAGGLFGEGLRQAGVVKTCDGVEPFDEAAVSARMHLRHVWSGTIESVRESIPWPDYDLVCMADVLEHLVDPWSALRLLHEHTRRECRLLLSVPNVRHYKVSLPLLLRDEFRYADHGIMDRTHLHFFTRSSLVESLDECGWNAAVIGCNMKKRYRKAWMPTSWIEPLVAVQYFVLAEKQ